MGEIASTFLSSLSPELHERAIQVVPDDPNVRVGELKNGLKYFIRSHDNPENRAFFRLVMHVGSLNEDDDQRGLAHILEHMAFNGSNHFGPQELDAYFQSIGMQFGAHVNASTGFDKTIYKLEIPTDDPEIIEQTFRVLQDWGSGLLLPASQIEKERLVGLEEWRGRRSGRMRTMEQMLPTLYWGSKYVDRLPIGTEESLKGFTHEALKRFYHDWYRPELCSLVIVGDIDADSIEQSIQSYLSQWENESSRAPEKVDVPIPQDRMIGVIHEDTIPYPMMMISQKKPIIHYRTEGGWAWNILKHELMIGAINERFRFLHRRPESKVQQASAMRNPLTKTCEQEGIHVVLDASDWRASVSEIVAQCKQLRTFGLTEGELERAKKRRLVAMKAHHDNIPTATSKQFLADVMSVVLEDESMWPSEALYELSERWVPKITLKDINAHVKDFLQGAGQLVHFLTPIDGITESDISELLDISEQIEVNPYEETVSSATLLPGPLPKSKLVSERINEELEIREWVFENGVKVWLKETDFDENMIGWAGYQEGGHSLMEDSAIYSAKSMTGVLQFSGAGPHSLDDISRLTDSVPGRFRWSVSENRSQVMGQSTREGLLPTLQHLWLESQHSKITTDSVDKVKSLLATRLSNDDDPETVYAKRRAAILYQGHPRRRRMDVEDIPLINIDGVQTAYNTFIKTAASMHFAVVGSFDWTEMQEVLSQTLGALPPVEPSTFIDRGIRLLEATERHEIKVFDEPKGSVSLYFVQTKSCGAKQRYQARILTTILQERLRKSLREKEAGTYHVSVDWNYNRHTEQSHFDVSFGCNPDRVSELETKALAIITQFVEEGITAAELELERGKMLRAYEKSIKKNGHWQNRMRVSICAGRDLMDLPNQLASIHELSLERMNECIREYYCLDNRLTIVGLPVE